MLIRLQTIRLRIRLRSARTEMSAKRMNAMQMAFIITAAKLLLAQENIAAAEAEAVIFEQLNII